MAKKIKKPCASPSKPGQAKPSTSPDKPSQAKLAPPPKVA